MSPNSLAHLSRSPRFWRDERLPFVEARTIADGRKVTYSRHAHEHFSIGVVTTGRSYYHYGADTFEISAGTVVLMNPGDVHACNPIANEPWSYQMVYIDTPWLTDLQHQLGFSTEQGYRPFNTPYTRDTVLYEGLLELYGILVDEQAEHLQKQSALVSYFTEVQQHRAFKQYYGLTPHAFLVNQRIQFARAQLRQGELIADVALAAGFADQAHFQRTFKQHFAATPGQYRDRLKPSINNPHWPPATQPLSG
ncbi:AraC family transcriptional regulator [Pseudomonas sp. NZIPFR-PS2]|nr:AraC family transcriptional regulator [Pseudomonas sp. NZIPFR-PS2]